MPGPPQLLIPPELHVDALTAAPSSITITAHPTALTAECPTCQQSSSHLHSHYVRVLADVPWCGIPVRWQVTVRRFRCRNSACAQHIFAERLDVATVSARRTDRLSTALELIGFALGGEAGARLATGLGFSTSPDTLLRVLRQTADPIEFPVTVCGGDDWAWRKGHRYGTLLVDLERHRVVDLLPDRSADGFAAWLQRHPSIVVISRDRGEEYAVGATRGAPEAIQVADRFHLVKNLGETVERVLKQHVRLLQQVPLPSGEPLIVAPPRADREAGRRRTRQKMRERFATIHALANAGLSQRAIARTTGWSRGTVRAYLSAHAPPERPQVTQRPSILTPYTGYLLERWRHGERNARTLWREIVALGYPGTHRNVSRFVTHLRQQERQGLPLSKPQTAGLTPGQTVRLFLLRSADRSPTQQAAIRQLRALHPDLATTMDLVAGFLSLIRHPPACPEPELLTWMQSAMASGIAEFRTFVDRLYQDLTAVVAGLTLPWSQGQTEGQILRLKLIRRQMYGRGNFDLLRKRVLQVA